MTERAVAGRLSRAEHGGGYDGMKVLRLRRVGYEEQSTEDSQDAM